jgi:cellulose biosynthesis protein BcsQ
MKIISLFNNKGGVGKTTLAYHLSCALAEMGKKVLMIDLDPQCNLTICGMHPETLHAIWEKEDSFIDDLDSALKSSSVSQIESLLQEPRTIHFLLKPTEDGQGEFSSMPPLYDIKPNLSLIPGRITINQFEACLAERWSGAYQGHPLSLRTITRIRKIAEYYGTQQHFDFIIVDTSPSLGALNKTIISTVDGFVIPALPDMFSLYGIRNIGKCLSQWKREFDNIYQLISDEKRKQFPQRFVRFLGYTIYNAKKYSGSTQWNLSKAHYNYALQIPDTISHFISEEVRSHLSDIQVHEPIGGEAVMHTHNTLPNMAQKYTCPIWEVPTRDVDPEDASTIRANAAIYFGTKDAYIAFAESFLNRVDSLDIA